MAVRRATRRPYWRTPPPRPPADPPLRSPCHTSTHATRTDASPKDDHTQAPCAIKPPGRGRVEQRASAAHLAALAPVDHRPADGAGAEHAEQAAALLQLREQVLRLHFQGAVDENH